MLTVSLLNATLAEVGVDLDLVDRRYDIGVSQQPLQVLGHKVADPNCSDLPFGQEGFQAAVSGQGALEFLWERLVKDKQIDHIDAEFASTFLERVPGLVIAVIINPHFGFNEYF